MPTVTTQNDLLRVHFDRFDLEAYRLFLKCKRLPESRVEFLPETETYAVEAPARFADMLGVERDGSGARELGFSSHLFDDQVAEAKMILDAKRFALWSNCGLGKTAVGLEVARHIIARTGGRVLITTKNEIVNQWLEESAKFYGDSLPIYRLHHREDMKAWCRNGPGTLAITNYEKWTPESLDTQVVSEAKYLAGVILDEADMLRASAGKQKWALIKSCRGIEYKLLLTATPAPNELMEFASQASFLEKMRSEGEIIWTFFTRDNKTHRWTVKKHARKAFFEWMSSWSIYVQDPRRYGWRKDMVDVPPPEYLCHQIPMTPAQRDHLQRFSADPGGQMQLPGMNDRDTSAIQRMKLSQVAKGFCYRQVRTGAHLRESGAYDLVDSKKPSFVADLIRSEVAAGHKVLVWTIFDGETDLIAQALGTLDRCDILTGKTKEGDREAIQERFRHGETDVLIARASMLGYGMNYQHVSSMIFSGWDDSFVKFYQAVRRAYRFGQTRSVRVHLPVIPELEGGQLDNVFRKQRDHERAVAEMEANYLKARRFLEGKAA